MNKQTTEMIKKRNSIKFKRDAKPSEKASLTKMIKNEIKNEIKDYYYY